MRHLFRIHEIPRHMHLERVQKDAAHCVFLLFEMAPGTCHVGANAEDIAALMIIGDAKNTRHASPQCLPERPSTIAETGSTIASNSPRKKKTVLPAFAHVLGGFAESARPTNKRSTSRESA
jgi:hypothetical protein